MIIVFSPSRAQNSCIAWSNWSGGWCSICGGQTGNYSCNFPQINSEFWEGGCKFIADCVPPGNLVTGISVKLWWNDGCCEGCCDQFNPAINGTEIGQIGPDTGVCQCGDCIVDTISNSWSCSTGGMPGYNYGDSNYFCLNYTGSCVCVDNAEITIYYTTSNPVFTPGAIAGQINPCQGIVQIYSVSPVTNASYYHWTLPVGWTLISGQGDTAITVETGAASGNICVTACDSSCQCGSWSCISVVSAPIVNIGNDTSLCNGDTLVLNAGNQGASYLWQDSSVNQTLNVVAPGFYYVKVTDTNGCVGSDSILISVPFTLLTGSSPDTNGNAVGMAWISVSGNSTPYYYLWVAPATGSNDTATGLIAGNYTVIVTDSNGCTDSATVSVGNVTGINGGPTAYTDNKLLIFPNPAKSSFTVYLSGNREKDIVNIAVMNVLGQTVRESSFSKAVMSFNLSGASPGIYFVRVQAGNKVLYGKVIKP